ncbi:hypothetical protein N356_gp003 [Cellulophaga phage phi14:2]|uniref:Uncharacterized protein n=1 Tax=Cellulophaga phage phi14:2 TaxID=1327990 RepID=S0A3R8_9CAUD|nr:hypothetical protein N356_gp003 [Cellulophaga phage phi14:2]AGO48883.1 hypothetical protein Phi14:2_gp005 [Cellulophaga phage phi14:2]
MSHLKEITEELFGCTRCGNEVTGQGNNIPCPRGGCEAKVIGVKVTRIILKKGIDIKKYTFKED